MFEGIYGGEEGGGRLGVVAGFVGGLMSLIGMRAGPSMHSIVSSLDFKAHLLWWCTRYVMRSEVWDVSGGLKQRELRRRLNEWTERMDQ